MASMTKTLRFLSYNIQGHAAAGRADFLPKLAEVIAAAHPDVVGLQEVHSGTRAGPGHQGEALAELTGLTLGFGRSCAMDGGDYGNAVLTRGALHEIRVHPLPGSGEPRSVLETEIELDTVRISFFVTHLAAWGRLLRKTRLLQIEELSAVTGRACHPRVLAGDFNVPPAAEEIRTLLANGHLRACGDPREVTFPQTRQRIDYIFADFRWGEEGSEVLRRGPSDHWGIVTDLTISTDG
jgi:endonuclease/exonuclease/phosphatase family metal-dependent hydrolase